MTKRKLLLALSSMLVFMTSVFLMGEQQSNAQDCDTFYIGFKKKRFGSACVEKPGYVCIERCTSQKTLSL